MHNVIIRPILAKRSYKIFILMSAVLIIKYIITAPPQTRLLGFTRKMKFLTNSFHIKFQTPQSIAWLQFMYQAFFKTQSSCAHSLPTSATKTFYPLPFKSYRCRNTSLLYAGVELPKGLKIFWKKGPPWLQQSQRNLIWPTYYLLQYRNYLPLSNVKSNNQPWTCLSDNNRRNIKIPNVGRV